MPTYGIDISKHQPHLNFNKVKKENQFVILRIGYGVTGGVDQKDSKFEEFYKEAKKVDLSIGGYYYSYAKTVEQAKQEAKNCLKYIGDKEFDMPIFYDIEDKSIKSSASTITAMCNAFCEIIENAGYKAGVYASTTWFRTRGVKNVKSNYVRWEAKYGKNDGHTISKGLYNTVVPMHQYTSKYKASYGKNGEVIKVDRNINYYIPLHETEQKESKSSTTVETKGTEKENNMLTAKQVTDKMKADYCSTSSRARNGKKKYKVKNNYSNKYTQFFGKLQYSGIAKDGYFTKGYSYGAVGHCCIAVQYWLYKCGYEKFVPKSPKYLFNTNNYMSWLKKNPKGSKWVTDPKKAKLGAIAFKGNAGKKETKASHTCVFLKTDGTYVWTVDFNVTESKSKNNNGIVKKRHKKYFRGFANLPYYVAPTTSKEDFVVGKDYTLQSNMNIRKDHNTKSAIIQYKDLSAQAQKACDEKQKPNAVYKAGTKVTCKEVYKTPTTIWLRTPSGWICAKDSRKTYVK